MRGFDDYIETGNAEVLHRLRIEVKRLRYILTQFSSVLGRSAQKLDTLVMNAGKRGFQVEIACEDFIYLVSARVASIT